ncbi:ABC transporter permease [Chloroflexota bacterium]
MEISSETANERKGAHPLADLLKRLLKEKPLGVVGGVIVLALFLVGAFADAVAPYGMNQIDLGARLAPPSALHLMGTDNLGRDLLTRIVFGARISMFVGLGATALTTLLSTLIGTISGFMGGKIDLVTQRFVDAFMCFPSMFLYLTIMAVLGPGLGQVIVVLGVIEGIRQSRVVRSAVIGIKGSVYVEAARAIGASQPRILYKHILPNIMAPIIIIFTVFMAQMIVREATLSFLGFGIPPPMPSWGGMLSEAGRRFMLIAPWIAVWPGIVLAVVVYGINMLGDALRDLLDPRLRGGLGRYGGVKVKEPQVQSSKG